MNNDRDKITKYKEFVDLSKELKYINDMNRKGWKLVYIKFGSFFTFVKTKPDEYVTIMHAADKETVSSLSTLAAQCGYENIPHTADGFGDFLYLTGKKSEVSESFVSDNESKARLYKKFQRRYRNFFFFGAVVSMFLLSMFAIPAGFLIYIIKNIDRFPTENLTILKVNTVGVFLIGITGIIISVLTIRNLFLSIRYKKRYRSVCNDMNVFE